MMETERVEVRALAAVRFVDAVTGLRVTSPLVVRASGVEWMRNLQNWYVVLKARGISAPFELVVTDPAGRYLPRRCTVPFPRDPDPARAGRADSLFRPVDVRLFRAPNAPTAPGWAVVRASVTHRESDEPLPGALIRVVRRHPPRAVLARGMSDARGEALVAVPGIPVTTWEESSDRVLTAEVEVRVQVYWDPEGGEVPDPDDVEERRSRLRVRSRSVTLAAGRVLVKAL